MTQRKYNLLDGSDELVDLHSQQVLINNYYPDVKTIITDRSLLCSIKIQDYSWANKYEIGIIYKTNFEPMVTIINPFIEPSSKIHMYSNRCLCLYYPHDYVLGKRFCIALEIIPWAIKWIYFYELYLINGNIWQGKEAPHTIDFDGIWSRRRLHVEKS